MQPNPDLQTRVQQALRQDSRIPANAVTATVAVGVVALSGRVSTFEQYEAAEQTALRTQGVLDVANEIEVSSEPALADIHIAEEVRASLKSCLHAESDHIQCSVAHGVVTLRGAVESWHDVANAEQAAAEICGVRDVVDEVVVEPAVPG